MSVSNIYGIYAAQLGAALLGGITRQSVVQDAEIKGEATSGEVFKRFVAMYAQRFAPSLTTMHVGSALTALGTMGLSIASLTGGFSLLAQKHAHGSTRATGTSHRKFNFLEGILAPRSLSVSHRGDATLTVEAVIVKGTGGDPLVVTDSVSLPTITADDERYTLGPVTVGSVTLNQKTNLQIDFGVDVLPMSADSEIWDTFASIRQQNTTITLTGTNLLWCSAAGIPLTGKPAVHADTVFYLQRRLNKSTFVDAATASHIKFTASGMAHCDRLFDGSNEAAETGVKIVTSFDGTNAPLVVTTGVAIT